MHAFSNHAVVLHNVTPIDFDIRTVSNDHNIWILHKVTPLDLLAQVAGTLGNKRRFYLTGWFFCIPTISIPTNRSAPPNHGYRKRNG